MLFYFDKSSYLYDMSKTSNYIIENDVDLSPEVDDSDTNIEAQAETNQQQRDYERVVRLGHPIEDLWG